MEGLRFLSGDLAATGATSGDVGGPCSPTGNAVGPDSPSGDVEGPGSLSGDLAGTGTSSEDVVLIQGTRWPATGASSGDTAGLDSPSGDPVSTGVPSRYLVDTGCSSGDAEGTGSAWSPGSCRWSLLGALRLKMLRHHLSDSFIFSVFPSVRPWRAQVLPVETCQAQVPRLEHRFFLFGSGRNSCFLYGPGTFCWDLARTCSPEIPHPWPGVRSPVLIHVR